MKAHWESLKELVGIVITGIIAMGALALLAWLCSVFYKPNNDALFKAIFG